MSGLFPIDQTLPPAVQTVAIEFEIHVTAAATADSPALKITVTGKASHKESVALVK
jgi:hypothetical protein